MAGGSSWSRRCASRARSLRSLVKDTQRALNDITDVLNPEPEISIQVQEIGNYASLGTCLVLLGTSAAARARLLHALLGRRLLPDTLPGRCRWLKIQYGSSTQVHLTLGNSEFELVEDLECNKQPWDVLPVEDLTCQDSTDLVSMLEVELNNQFLKDGLKIIIPPHLESNHNTTSYKKLKEKHEIFLKKREIILSNFNPVYLYAIDRIGRNIFSENIKVLTPSKSEEDFWKNFDLYNVGVKREGRKKEMVQQEDETMVEEAVLSPENCLDLHQIKELNPNSQLLFILLSDSTTHTNTSMTECPLAVCTDATESTEENLLRDLPESDREIVIGGMRPTTESPQQNKSNTRLYEEQIVFMNELIDQWELMTSPPPKHHTKSQWTIINDVTILRTAETKSAFLSDSIGKGKDKTVEHRSALINIIVKFASECLQSYLLECCSKLSEIHVKLLQQFILASFDMARELQVVPKKIQYVATQEQQLYETIHTKFSEGDKKQELLELMGEVLTEMKTEVINMDWSVDDLPWHQDRRYTISNSVFYASSRSSPEKLSIQTRQINRTIDNRTTNSLTIDNRTTNNRMVDNRTTNSLTIDNRTTMSRTDLSDNIQSINHSEMDDFSDGEEAVSYESYNFDDYEIIDSNDESFASDYYRKPSTDTSSQINTIPIENESEFFSLSNSALRSICMTGTHSVNTVSTCNTVNISVKNASLDVQQTVLSQLSRKISLKLVKFVDCLKDSYFGTLQRCLESLECSCVSELGGRPASEAMRQLLSVARRVDLTPVATFSLLTSLLDSFTRLCRRLKLSPNSSESACCVLSPVWRRKVALSTVSSLSAHRLTRIICQQILERLTVAHDKYQSALTSLESALANRLHHTEDVKLAIRKKYAPSFARLCLESTSMCDLLMYGIPELGREIGRGVYGVVYSSKSWAGKAVAVKSVLPHDDRHYHDLAMEFFYTRSIPSHPRIVKLYGSIVQRCSNSGPSVLLVSERKVRDLHAAIRAGLSFSARMRVSLDIVEGIRYLHSLGLVHRDIKMKNVLLDAADRASLSDLGFCASSALVSGSVVGTPVHMAPELLAGVYQAEVDVYAFAILFWFVCAGNVKLPEAFEAFQNKEQLWSKVRKGLRPERLPHFTDECWDIMSSCWASEPSERALLGDVQPRLEAILQQALNDETLGQPIDQNSEDNDDRCDILNTSMNINCL